mgnify:CR=1 FL=1
MQLCRKMRKINMKKTIETNSCRASARRKIQQCEKVRIGMVLVFLPTGYEHGICD